MTQTGVHYLDARAPEGMRLYAIGDVHGRLDLLTRMHETITAEIERDGPADWRIVHLGDYCDRGPDTKGVLDFLTGASRRDPRIVALAGNHDAGMLDFLERPETDGLFALYGGRQTARSYGVDISFTDRTTMLAGHAELLAAIPDSHFDFLRTLPRSACWGDYFFCHAGVRPGIPLEQQDPEDLIWIRQPFLGFPGLLPKVVVHGHTPVSEAEVLAHRVDVDTGAVVSGKLTAFVAEEDRKRLLSVEI